MRQFPVRASPGTRKNRGNGVNAQGKKIAGSVGRGGFRQMSSLPEKPDGSQPGNTEEQGDGVNAQGKKIAGSVGRGDSGRCVPCRQFLMRANQGTRKDRGWHAWPAAEKCPGYREVDSGRCLRYRQFLMRANPGKLEEQGGRHACPAAGCPIRKNARESVPGRLIACDGHSPATHLTGNSGG